MRSVRPYALCSPVVGVERPRLCLGRSAYDGGVSVLDVLLEGYNPAEARGRGGRWIRVGAHVTVHPYGHGIVTRAPSEAGSEKYGQHELATVKFDRALGQEGKSLVTRAQKLRPTSSSSRERGAAEVDAHMQAFKRGEVSRPRVRGDGRSGPVAPSAPAKPRKSSPLDEVVSFGGIPTKLGDVIAQLQREGHPQAYIDRYVQGLARGRAARSQESAPEVLGALLDRDFSAERRRKLASSGAAMKDGSFPIENAGDLSNAVQAVGRASSPDAAKAHIRKRAKALGLTSRLPDGW